MNKKKNKKFHFNLCSYMFNVHIQNKIINNQSVSLSLSLSVSDCMSHQLINESNDFYQTKENKENERIKFLNEMKLLKSSTT